MCRSPSASNRVRVVYVEERAAWENREMPTPVSQRRATLSASPTDLTVAHRVLVAKPSSTNLNFLSTMSKKGSKAPKESTYEYRDIVLAKVRGYPPWPGMVRVLGLNASLIC